ncbi:MAG: hypothetical protein ACMUIG_07850 [Thermoplasmatota archaeon]
MFDRKDIQNLGTVFEKGLSSGGGSFDEEQTKTLRTAFELAMVNAFRMIENRVETKHTQEVKK